MFDFEDKNITENLCKEYDLIMLDRLAEELLGIKNIIQNADKIKKVLSNEAVSSEVFRNSHL